MSLARREFIRLAAGGLAAGAWGSSLTSGSAPGSPLRAVAFDAFAIFDPRPIGALAESLFPGKGPELTSLWRTRQFEYQWLRSLTGRYADFRQTTEDGLVFAARALRLELTDDKRSQLMQSYFHLGAWPDAPGALRSLRAAGLRLAFLSNMTAAMLATGIESSGLSGIFDQVLSTDSIKSYKPAPRAYRLAVDSLRLKPQEILFAAFAGWDAAGARSFGYPTFWVNRLDFPAEELGIAPDAVGRDLADLVKFSLPFP